MSKQRGTYSKCTEFNKVRVGAFFKFSDSNNCYIKTRGMSVFDDVENLRRWYVCVQVLGDSPGRLCDYPSKFTKVIELRSNILESIMLSGISFRKFCRIETGQVFSVNGSPERRLIKLRQQYPQFNVCILDGILAGELYLYNCHSIKNSIDSIYNGGCREFMISNNTTFQVVKRWRGKRCPL